MKKSAIAFLICLITGYSATSLAIPDNHLVWTGNSWEFRPVGKTEGAQGAPMTGHQIAKDVKLQQAVNNQLYTGKQMQKLGELKAFYMARANLGPDEMTVAEREANKSMLDAVVKKAEELRSKMDQSIIDDHVTQRPKATPAEPVAPAQIPGKGFLQGESGTVAAGGFSAWKRREIGGTTVGLATMIIPAAAALIKLGQSHQYVVGDQTSGANLSDSTNVDAMGSVTGTMGAQIQNAQK